ncbi:VOC family protein [Vibrio sonorensis]|uniref:VOC family protein n=1 Tax=Vibrio sonorensis TaxID=1004316 RepID=UPI0008D98FEF|nr:VOC family protein [Vibrio sonorensis]
MIQVNSVFQVFIIEDLKDAKTFYQTHFGFQPVFENEWYLHLASQSGIQIAFMLPNQPTQPNFFQAKHTGDGVIYSIDVEDAKLAYQYATKNDLNIQLTLRDEDWGQRHFVVQDPNGLYVDIAQAIDATDDYNSGYIKQ